MRDDDQPEKDEQPARPDAPRDDEPPPPPPPDGSGAGAEPGADA